MEERGDALVVRLDRVGDQIGLGQDGGTEELAAGSDACTGQGDDVGLGKREEAGDEGLWGVARHGVAKERRYGSEWERNAVQKLKLAKPTT